MNRWNLPLASLSCALFIFGVGSSSLYGRQPTIRSLDGDRMSGVLGGDSQCINFCSQSENGCAGNNKLCKGPGDNGELCGSAETTTGAAWGCMTISGATGNCTPTGGDSSCKATLCHCRTGGACDEDRTQSNNSGKAQCSD